MRACAFLIAVLFSLDAGGESVGNEFRNALAITTFLNVSGTNDLDHWKYTIPLLFKLRLKTAEPIMIVPDSSVDFAFSVLHADKDNEFTPELCLQIGEVIEANWVLSGSYSRQGAVCKLNVNLSNTSSGQNKKFSCTSSNYLEAVGQLEEPISREIGVRLEMSGDKQDEYPFPQSIRALELFSRASFGMHTGTQLAKIEEELKAALNIDNHFALAAGSLAYVLILENKLDEAGPYARLFTNLAPKFHSSHYILGSYYFASGLNKLAEDEFKKAVSLDPHDSDSYVKLNYICAQNGRWNECIGILKNAELMTPYDCVLHAEAARAYCHLQKREQALNEIALANRYKGRDPGIEHTIGDSFLLLNDVPRAIAHYEAFVASAKAIGVQSSLVDSDSQLVTELKKRLQPTAVIAEEPHSFTAPELDSTLKQRLVLSTSNGIANPLALTDEIRETAVKLAAGAETSFEKAQKLFTELERRINTAEQSHCKTAQEAFDSWRKSSGGLSCQDYALLYTSMARAVGLKAYFVMVDQDYSGRYVSHACSAVFLNDNVFLVDPAYNWFGVPHRKYQVEDDLHVVGFVLCQSTNPAEVQLGLKLTPDWAELRFGLAVDLINLHRLDEAKEMLGAGGEINPNSWNGFFALGFFYWSEKKWSLAVENLKKSLSINEEFPLSHYLLATALFESGILKGARMEFRKYLELETSPQLASIARETILSIDENKELNLDFDDNEILKHVE